MSVTAAQLTAEWLALPLVVRGLNPRFKSKVGKKGRLDTEVFDKNGLPKRDAREWEPVFGSPGSYRRTKLLSE